MEEDKGMPLSTGEIIIRDLFIVNANFKIEDSQLLQSDDHLLYI